MNPVGVLLLPVSVVVLAGTTVSPAPARPVQHTHPARSTIPATRSIDRTAQSTGQTTPAVRLPQEMSPDQPSPALRGRWGWPLQPRPPVVRPFVRPATKYGAGHRGVDLGGSSGQEVRAVEAGTVSHVGRIAGRGTVTVLHSSGVRSTYEPVDPVVTTGSMVARGAPLGRLEESGSHCGVASCLHLGAIRGEDYLDPLVFLVGGRRVRLLPLGQVPEG